MVGSTSLDPADGFVDLPFGSIDWTSSGVSLTVGTAVSVSLVSGTVSTNNAPTVANAILDQTATAGTALTYAFPANTFADTDTGDTLAYTATKSDDSALPPWLSFAAATRTFSGTPQAADVGTVSVKVTASDGTDSVSDTFDIVVSAAANTAPVFADATTSRSFTETVGGAAVSTAGLVGAVVTATDAEGDTLTYSLEGTDVAKFGIVSGSGQIRTKVGEKYDREAKASYSVTVKADDGNGGSDTIAVTINVNNEVEKPVAPDMPTVTATSGITTSLDVSWMAPANTGRPPITGYKVQYRPDAGGNWLTHAHTGTGTTATIASLTAATAYQVHVLAVNSDGDGPFSSPGAGTTGTVTVTNTAPTSADEDVEADEDMDYTFSSADFLFTDTDTGDSLASVKIVTLPASGKGTLTLSGTAIGSGDLPKTVPAAEIDDLKYSPPANLYGMDFASFTFKVNDGTVDSDDAYTMYIDVQGMDDPATGKPGITGTAQVGRTLIATVGTIADVDGLPDPFISAGLTTIQWIQVDGVNETDISGATSETYTLATADEGKKIKVKVWFQDDDGTAKGPLTSDAYPSSGTVTAAPVTNTAPTGADKTVTIGSDTAYTFSMDDFGFADADAADTLASVRIEALPGAGALALDSTAVSLNDVIPSADIGDLTFTPVTGGSGDNYANFTFKVNDGTVFSDSANTITFNVRDLSCAAPSFGDRREIWSGTVTVERFESAGLVFYGFDEVLSAGTLLPGQSFSIGSNSYVIDSITVAPSGTVPPSGNLHFSLEGFSALTSKEGGALRLHVCDGDYDFITSFSSENTTTWLATTLDWSPPVVTRTLYLSLPANNAATGEPAISGTARAGQELTAVTTGIMDTDGLTDVDFTYQWLRVDADGTSNEEDISGEIAATYTLTDDDVGKKIKVKVSFTDELSAEEERTSAAYPSSGAVTASANTTAPALLSVTVTSTPRKTSDTYGAREHIEFSMTFDAPVTVTGDPTFAFDLGGATTATWYAGSGTTTLRFSHAVSGGSSGDRDTNGISWAANALNGGTIAGADNAVAAVLPHVAQSNLVGHKVDGRTTAVTAATVTVAVTSTPTSLADTYGFGETIVITVTVSEAVEVVGDPEFEFSLTDMGGAANDVPATYDRTRGSPTTIVFTYTVQAGDRDNNGISIGNHSSTFMLDVNDRIRTASQQIDIDRSHPEKGTHTGHKVDGSLGAPTVPPDPTPPTLVSATATTLTIEWTHPGDGGSPLTRNFIEYRVEGTTGWTNWYRGETPTPVTRAVIRNLAAETAYDVRVHSRNAIGNSQWTQSATAFSTLANTEATGVDLTGIEDADGLSNPVDIADATDATYTLVDADLGTTLKVRVTFDDGGGNTETRTSAATATVTTAAGAPDSPTNLSATVGVGQVVLVWQHTSEGGTRSHYEYRFSVGEMISPDAMWQQALSSPGTPNQAYYQVVKGLTSDTTHTLQVRAVNTQGGSAPATVTVTPLSQPSCTIDELGDRRRLWQGQLTAGIHEIATDGKIKTGYGEEEGTIEPGTLTPAAFTFRSTSYSVYPRTSGDLLTVVLVDPDFTVWYPREEVVDALRWHVCNTPYDFSNAQTTTPEDLFTSFEGFRWNVGSIWPPGIERTLRLSLPPNHPATGDPVISGTVQVGEELTALTDGIMDDDVLDDVFTYQWVRVDADGTSNEEDITDETDATYTLTADDRGKQVKVEVRFVDILGGEETRTIAASGTVPGTNTAPVFSPSSVSREIAENTAAGQNVGAAVTATDADAGDTLGYALGGADAASFAIVGDSGQIRTKTNVSYDFEAKSSYTVTVTATDNSNATAVADVTIGVTDVDEPPSAPATPMVSAVSGSTASLSVSWAAPANAGKPAIANYDVQYREGTSGAWTDGQQDVTGTSTTIASLVADTLYEARVRASNAEGDSGWSAPPGSGRTNAPTNNAPVFSSSSVSREIAENTAAGVDVGAAVTATDADAGDTLGYMLGGADVASFDFVGTTGQIRTKSGVSYDHEAKASYTVTVTASDGTATAAASVTIGVTDVDEPPSAPATPAVSAVSGSTASLSVSWAAPANAGKPAIASYDVQYRVGSSGTWSDGPEDVTGTTTTIASLVADTLYEARVRASNSEGDSGWSDPPGSGRTNAASTSAPGAPGNLRTAPGDGRVALAWTAPGSDGGAAIEKYRYRVSADGGSSWDPDWTDVPDGPDAGGSAADETTFTVSGLSNGTEYVFQLRAVNSVGEGPAASATGTPARAPLPPGSGFLVGNFGQPADGASRILVTQDIVGVFTTGARGAELHNIEFRLFSRLPDIAQLPSATLYSASVTDTRARRGERVAALTAAPGSPRPSATAQTVAFTAPPGTRLEAGATYMVVLVASSGWVGVENTTFPAEDAGGAPGWAIDGIGAGNSSPYSYGTTASLLMRVNGTAAGPPVATAPDVPASLGAAAGDARVNLIWTPPRSDGGAGIEKYQYRYSAGSRVDPDTAWTDVPDGSDTGTSRADERSVSVTELDKRRQYAFELRAVNGVRAGAAATATATPAAARRTGFLVSNFGQPVDGSSQISVTHDIVGAFTAGALGATLDSIEFRLYSRTPDIAQRPSATLYRGSVTDTRATPGTRVATLTAAPGSPRPAASARTIVFAAPGGTRLDAGATYLVVLEGSGYVRVEDTNSSAQDAGGASGWTIDGVGAGNSSPYSYGTSGSLLMSVNGTTARAQRAVREKAAKDGQQEEEQVREPATSPDPDRGISLSTSGSSAIEGQAVTIGVRRAGPTDRTTSVAVQVFDSALTGAWPIDLDFRSGVATATATVAIPFDGARPASRTVTVRLAGVEEPYSVGSPSTLTFNVTDRDAALSVDDASVSEGPAATLAFAVTLDRTRDREVRVKYATSDGTATQGDDYTGVSGTLRFAAGETTKTVSVPVVDDVHNEDSETLTLTLSNARGAAIDDATAVGTIVNSDPLPDAWLSRFGRAASDQVVQSIGRRLEGGARESHLTVMGWRADSLFESSHPERDGRGRRPGAPGRQPEGSVLAPDGRIGAAGAMAGGTRGVGAMSGPGAARPAFEGAMTQGFPPMRGGTLQGPARAVGGLPGNVGGNPASAAAMGARDNRWLDLMGRLFMSLGPNGGEALAMPGLRDMVMGSSFYYGYSPDAGPLRGMNRLTAWGESASTRFSGAEGKLSLDGEVNTAILGADGEWGRWLAGLALSYSEGEGGYRQASAKGGAVSSTLSGINPYARYRLDERTSLWGTLGYGSGRLTLTPDGAESALETDMTNAMAAFGGRGVLSMRRGETGQFELALRTDAMLTDTASMAVAGLSAGEGATSRIRLILEGSGSLPAFGGVLAPRVEAGLRYDGGDAETGAGLEVGGGLAYDKARLTVQVDGRVLLTHRDRDYEEWGYSLSFVYKPGEDGRGLRYRAGSRWGATQSGVQSLWSLQNAGGLANGARTADGQRYTAELGYGFGVRRLWYPYVATESGGASSQALRFGLKLNAGSALEAGLEIGRRAHLSGQIENDIRLRWQARW